MPRRIEKLREVDTKELEVQQRELAEQIFRLRFQLTTGQPEALKRLRQARKDLAARLLAGMEASVAATKLQPVGPIQMMFSFFLTYSKAS